MKGNDLNIKVVMKIRKGDFDKFMLHVRLKHLRHSCGCASGSAKALKIKYVDKNGDIVLIVNDDKLALSFKTCEEAKSKMND